MENYYGQYYQAPAVPPEPPQTGMSRGRKIVIVVIAVLLLAGILLAGGFFIDRLLFKSDSNEEFVLEDSKSYQEALDDIKRYFYYDYSEEKITRAADDAVEKAKKEGVKSDAKLLNIGMNALTEALGDEHTGYLTPEENKRLSDDLSGSFFGVGFTLREEDGRPKVITVLEGSPAEKAGVKADDIIMSVDGKSTKNKSLNNVVLQIRGERGTEVTIKVKRKGEEKQKSFTMTREKIEIPDFESELLDGRYGYLNLMEFNEGAGDKVRKAITELQSQGAQGFILDLRNNPGGLLEEAVNVSSAFVDNGVIVSYQTKGRDKVDLDAEGGAATNLPLVVLINGGSASSSEIVAGALRDRNRATLVGSTSYGKGSVQKLFDLSNEGSLKLTVSLYYLPNGETIDKNGIRPTIVVEVKDNPEEEAKQQLDKAKQVLENLIQGKSPEARLLLEAA